MYCVVGRVMDISPCDVGGLESDTYFHPHWRGSSYQNTTGKEKGKQADIFSLMKSLPTGPVVTLVQPPTSYSDLSLSYVGYFAGKAFRSVADLHVFLHLWSMLTFEANSTLITCNLITQRSCVQMLEGLTRKLLTSFCFHCVLATWYLTPGHSRRTVHVVTRL